MKKIFKKVITPTFLIIFLFVFLISFNKSLAQTQGYTLKVNAASALGPGISTMLVAVVTPAMLNGGTVVFDSSSEYFLSQKTCKIPVNGTQCSSSFNSSIEKTFLVNATLHDNTYELDISNNKINSLLVSNNIGASIKVFSCKAPQVMNTTKDGCIDPNTNTNTINTDTTYTMLAPLPGLEGTINTVDDCPFGKYLNIIIKLIMGISAVLAMVMITMGGIQYVTSDFISSKEAGRETITHAVLGLVMLLGSFLILKTVNPKLLNSCLKIPTVTIDVSPEQAQSIRYRTGGGTCAVVTDVGSPCHPSKLTAFTGTTSATAPFDTKAAQASAICQLESAGVPNNPVGKSPSLILDKCSDNKPFSFGLFQINAAAHRNNIPLCKNAFEIPSGNGQSQGDCLEKDKATGYCTKWSCKTIEPAYTECQNYLINPINNIQFAATSSSLNRWGSWSTYSSCVGKF